MNYRDFVIIPNPDYLRTLFAAGQTLGLRSRIFAKVGESNSYWPHFLQTVGKGWAVYDHASKELKSTVRYFMRDTARIANSFADPSIATIRGGDMADQLKAYGELTGYIYYRDIVPADTSPLVAYYDLIQPAYSVLMVGGNDLHHQVSASAFREDLINIVGDTLARSIIPILTTLPPMVNRDAPYYNEIIKTTAAGIHLPLIDLYAAVVDLPRGGIGDDGVHMSYPPDGNSADLTAYGLQYGYNMRNYLTIGALKDVCKLLNVL